MHEAGLDVSRLEAAPPALTSASVLPSVAAAATVQSAGRPVRKSRIPKHVVLGVTPPPDPERWLKKRDRAREVRKSKKGKKEGMGAGATQGVIVGAVPASPTPTSIAGGKKKKKQAR
jgi:signal recognition particle subunit SRP72